MKSIKRILTVCIAVITALTLSACSVADIIFAALGFFGAFNGEEISLEYTLTEEDLTAFTEIVKECEMVGLEGTNVFAINSAFSEMMEQFEYIETQSMIGYLEYCQDQTSESALAHYTESETMMASVRTQYMEMLKKLAESSPIKDELFAGWSEAEMAMLLADTERISALQLENSEITRDFYALSEDENWSKNVNALYEQLVDNNQQMAQEYGYDNYYAFASEMVYSRDYTAEQRAAFRAHVAEYIVPLFTEIYDKYDAAVNAMTAEQQNEYTAVYSNDEYLYGYMDSYWGSMNDKMYAMFERKNAAIFADGENALEGAFTAYLSDYAQPLAYFGPGYQDVFTVVHEMGHYVSYYYFEDGVLPYDLAETHSQGNEWLFLAYLEEHVSSKVHETLYLERALNGLGTVILCTVVDHFEEIVYTAETPIQAEAYETVMDSVCAQYEGLEEALAESMRYSPFEYVQRVALPHPVYYLNYATSEIASMGLYALAQEKDYEQAQDVYTLLQEGIDAEANFTTAITEAGLLSPFAEQTYVDLRKVFLGE